MRSIMGAAVTFSVAALAAFPFAARGEEAPSPGALETIGVAVDASIYGLPAADLRHRTQAADQGRPA